MADRVKRAACTVAEMAPGETKTIYYLHIPKAGGSTFVKMATHNADPFVPNRNGNPVFPTGDLVRFWEWSEQTQLRFLTAGPHTFVANETGLGATPPRSDRIAYVTILRDPLDRTLSGYRHLRSLGYEKQRSFSAFVRAVDARRPRRHNAMVRMLAGVPIERSVGHGDLTLAMERLARFDVVLTLDAFGSELRQMRRYGWRQLSPRRFRRGTHTNSDTRAELRDDPEGFAILKELEKYDLELWTTWRKRAGGRAD